MVFIDLIVTLETEFVKEFGLTKPEEHAWGFEIKCAKCGAPHSKTVFFDANDLQEIPGSKGYCNFLVNCKTCNNNIRINVREKSYAPIDCLSGNTTAKLAGFECRGCELEKWYPEEGFYVIAEDSENLFDDLDLKELWIDYDEDESRNISIDKFNYEFKISKS